jgi:acetyltransferase
MPVGRAYWLPTLSSPTAVSWLSYPMKRWQPFNELLPAAWSRNNPVDILGDGSPERYAKALDIAARDPNSDGMLVILTPQSMTDPTQTAEELKPFAKTFNKPILASWMGGEDVEAGEMILNRANIPTFPYPDTAARMFAYMAQYAENLKSLYETPVLHGSNGFVPNKELATQIIQHARQSGRTILTEYESKQLLAAYGIPTVETRIATTEADAVQAAAEIGYPVVLKLHSETVTHKTDVGGVLLDLPDEAAVRQGYNSIQTSVTEKPAPSISWASPSSPCPSWKATS